MVPTSRLDKEKDGKSNPRTASKMHRSNLELLSAGSKRIGTRASKQKEELLSKSDHQKEPKVLDPRIRMLNRYTSSPDPEEQTSTLPTSLSSQQNASWGTNSFTQPHITRSPKNCWWERSSTDKASSAWPMPPLKLPSSLVRLREEHPMSTLAVPRSSLSEQAVSQASANNKDSNRNKKLEDGIDELLALLRSSKFIGTVVPEFHAPYLEALDDFGSKIKDKQRNAPTTDAPGSPAVPASISLPASTSEGSLIEPLEIPEGFSCSSPRRDSKRKIAILIDHRRAPPAPGSSPDVVLKREVKRLRRVLSSQAISMEARCEGLNRSLSSLQSLITSSRSTNTISNGLRRTSSLTGTTGAPLLASGRSFSRPSSVEGTVEGGPTKSTGVLSR